MDNSTSVPSQWAELSNATWYVQSNGKVREHIRVEEGIWKEALFGFRMSSKQQRGGEQKHD